MHDTTTHTAAERASMIAARAFRCGDRGTATRAAAVRAIGFAPVVCVRSDLRPGDRTIDYEVVDVASEIHAGQLRDQHCQSRHLMTLRRIGPATWSKPWAEYCTGLRTDLADREVWIVRRDA